MTARLRGFVAAAVVLVLSGTPVAASACAWWCPQGAPATSAHDESVPMADDTSACAALHGHAPAPPADAAYATDAGVTDAADPALATAATPPIHALTAAGECCDALAAGAGRLAASIDPPVASGPPTQAALSPVTPRRRA